MYAKLVSDQSNNRFWYLDFIKAKIFEQKTT